MRVLVSLALLGALSAAAAAPRNGPRAKKLIEYGWDVPEPAYVRDHIREMEQRPFDGVMMRTAYGGGRIFANEKWDAARMAPDIEALRAIEWRRFTDNFLMLYAASKMDWFSDADWKTVVANLRLYTRAARAGRCKGLVFDAEPYGDNPWAWASQKHASTKSFEEYQRMVRKRGAQFVRAIMAEMPDARILTFFQLSLFSAILDEPDPAKRQSHLAGDGYGLLPAFLNGMLDAAGPGITITDGNEPAYYYTSPLDYYRAYHTMRQRALSLVAPENRTRYQTQVQASQALYVDYVFKYWDRHYVAEFLTPEERARWFEHNVYYALATSDEYVWLYSEKMNWWKNENLPPGLEEAVISARAKIAAGKPLGFDLAETMRAAKEREEQALAARLVTRTAEISRAAEGRRPKVDGKLDDAVWRERAPLEPFIGYGTQSEEKATPRAQTTAWVAYDDTHLYVAFQCAEPTPGEIKSMGERRDDPVWEGDSVDLFVAAGEGPDPYYHFILSPKNVRWDAFCRGTESDTSYDAPWESATAIEGDQWCAEVAIPWSSLKRTAPEPGTRIRANLCRQRIPGSEQSCWSQTATGFVEPARFGTWVFR